MNEVEARTVFDSLSGNSGLTEEFIYTKTPEKGVLYKVLSGSTVDANQLGYIVKCVLRNNRNLRVYENKQGILVVRKGKAGQMFYLKPDNYTVTDDAYVLSLREDFKKISNIVTSDDEKNFLLWFICTHQAQMFELASSSDNSTWNKTNFLTTKILIPEKEEIAQIAELYSSILNLVNKIAELIGSIIKLKLKNIDTCDFINKGIIPISKLLKYVSRNDALSEEGIYKRLPDKDDKEPIQVLSGSSENIYYGKISSKIPNIHTLDEKQGLHVISRGQAGKIAFMPLGRYATNTNAFLFYLKSDIEEKAEITSAEDRETYIKFLRIYLQPIFYHASSESDLSVFPLTELMKNLQVPLFVYSESMRKMVQECDILDYYENRLSTISSQLDSLLQKQIV
jgi:hypothetical protein